METIKYYHKCGAVFSVANFWVNSAGCSGEFYVIFKLLSDVKNLILNNLKDKSFACWGILLLPWLNFDLKFQI